MITLLKIVQPDLEEPQHQTTTFSLIRAILSRQLVVMEVYDLMDTISRVLITNQSKQVRELCRQTYVQFILYYPHGNERFANQLTFLLNQLQYKHESGRESILDLFNIMLKKFSDEIFTDYSDMIFIRLAMALANDKSPRCREMTSVLIKNLILRLGIGMIETPLTLIEKWYTQDSPELCRLSIQLFGLFVDAFASKSIKWAPVWILNINAVLTTVFSEWKEMEEDVETLSLWESGYVSLVTYSKLLNNCPILHADDHVNWTLISDMLLHPHQWIRTVAGQLIGSLFSHTDGKSRRLAGKIFEHSSAKEVNILSTENDCKRLARRFCDQLDSDLLTAELGRQIVKNLFFLSNSLMSFMNHKGTKETPATALEDLAIEVMEPGTGLLWLTKRLSFLARAESGKRQRGILLVLIILIAAF
jgi:U3 small nucleolar RNA-associated protein 20